MFIPLPLPSEMAQWDAEAVKLGIPVNILMENAARETLHSVREHLDLTAEEVFFGQRCLVFMGGGNNGGDAVCLARHLYDLGADVLVVHTRPLSKLHGAAACHTRLAKRCGVAFVTAQSMKTCASAVLHHPHIVIDGLLGTGFSGNVREHELQVIRQINDMHERALIVALDVPSGLCARTGAARPEAVCAHLTVAFEAAKPGLVLPVAKRYVGQLRVRPIGIPRCIRDAYPPSYQLVDARFAMKLPSVVDCAHKGSSGHVLTVAGSEAYAGAAHLAVRGALRAGAGQVTLAAPQDVAEQARCALPDMILLPLVDPETGTKHAWTPDMADVLRPYLATFRSIVLGPGLGRDVETQLFVERFLSFSERPSTVIDADALYALAQPDTSGQPSRLHLVRPDDILTPHPGEAATLLGCPTRDVTKDRFEALYALMGLASCVWLLKGSGTLIGQQAQNTACTHPIGISPIHAPNLAVGGSGDVLAGCMGAFLSQGLSAFDAACAAVDRHTRAGLALAESFPSRGNLASDIAEMLPFVHT